MGEYKVENQVTYKEVDHFFSEMLGKPDIIYQETDYTLKDTKGRGMLYYPKCIGNLIHTDAVKRLARILQTGAIIYQFPNMYHTRLEHSKGTYYRTLELLLKLYSQEDIKEFIHKNKKKKYMIAELVRALLHDVGHAPFSHTMETVCNLPKGFHEDIGMRLIKEDQQLREALEKIYPNLAESIEEVDKRNFLGLNRLFEGQIDVDRGDFLPRDSFFANVDVEKNSKIVSELFNHVSLGKITDANGKTNIVPIFDANQIQNIETFLENRFQNYKNIYYNPKADSYEFIFKAFANRLVNGKEEYKLKKFLAHNINKTPEEVDLQEYVSYDDVEFMKGMIEVSEQTKDPILQKLALLSLPSQETVENIFYGLMISSEQVDEEGNRKNTGESDEIFIQKLIAMKEKKNLYQEYVTILNSSHTEDISIVKEKLKQQLQISDEELEKIGIISWQKKVASYKQKPGEEIYIKDEEGKVYEYTDYPKRKSSIQEETVAALFILTPLLEANGYSNQQIEQIRAIVEEYNRHLLEEERE